MDVSVGGCVCARLNVCLYDLDVIKPSDLFGCGGELLYCRFGEVLKELPRGNEAGGCLIVGARLARPASTRDPRQCHVLGTLRRHHDRCTRQAL